MCRKLRPFNPNLGGWGCALPAKKSPDREKKTDFSFTTVKLIFAEGHSFFTDIPAAILFDVLLLF
jgi:hypothetical protein